MKLSWPRILTDTPRTAEFCYAVAQKGARAHASINEASCCFTRKFFCRFSTNHSTRSHQRADAVRRRLRAPRHAMALGVSARHQRLHSEDAARELRTHR